jgi:hypothetical protein
MQFVAVGASHAYTCGAAAAETAQRKERHPHAESATLPFVHLQTADESLEPRSLQQRRRRREPKPLKSQLIIDAGRVIKPEAPKRKPVGGIKPKPGTPAALAAAAQAAAVVAANRSKKQQRRRKSKPGEHLCFHAG